MADEQDLDLGPIDYVVIEFPAGTSNFDGAMSKELLSLVDAGLIDVLDLVILRKGEAGEVDVLELEDLGDPGSLKALEATMAEVLAADDLAVLAEAVDPGTVAIAIVWENTWAAPFAVAARESGGQLVASDRIPTQALLAAAADTEGA